MLSRQVPSPLGNFGDLPPVYRQKTGGSQLRGTSRGMYSTVQPNTICNNAGATYRGLRLPWLRPYPSAGLQDTRLGWLPLRRSIAMGRPELLDEKVLMRKGPVE